MYAHMYVTMYTYMYVCLLTSDSSSSVERLAKNKKLSAPVTTLTWMRQQQQQQQQMNYNYNNWYLCLETKRFEHFFVILVPAGDVIAGSGYWVMGIFVLLACCCCCCGATLLKHTQSEYYSFRSLSKMRSFCGRKSKYCFYFEINKNAHYIHSVCSGRQSGTIYVWIEFAGVFNVNGILSLILLLLICWTVHPNVII